MIVVWVVIAALGDSLGEPSITPLFAESVEEDRRGTAFSLLSLIWFVPGFYSYMLAGYLAESYGERLIIAILFVEVTSFLIFVAFVKETLRERRPVELRRVLESIKGALRPRGGLTVFYVFAILDRFAWSMSSGIFVAMLTESTGFTLLQIGTLTTATAVATTVALIPAGKLVDRFGSKGIIVVSTLLSVLLFGGYMATPGYYAFLALQAVRGFSMALFDPAYSAYLSKAVDESERGKVFGSLNGLKGVFSIPAPIIGAFLFESYGFPGTFSVSLALTLVALAFSFKIRE